MRASELKKRVGELKKLLASDDPDRVANAVALGTEPLVSLLASLPAPAGLGFEPGWRVKRADWPAVQRTLAAVVHAHGDAAELANWRHAIWMPPDLWPADLASEHARRGPEGLPLVRVPAGGSLHGHRASYSKHTRDDCHPVTISRDLWVGATPVTLAQWCAVTGDAMPEDSDPLAPAFVKHVGAIRFCNALSEREGLQAAYDASGVLTGLDAEGYRLLTEAEWEHAARAGTETATYAGEVKVQYGQNPSLDCAIRYGEERGSPSPPVGTRVPNALGLYDMLGLAWERVQDEWSRRRPQGLDPLYDGSDLPDEARGIHVIRGGSYVDFAGLTTASSRLDDGGRHQAFRVARKASEVNEALAAAVPEAPAVLRSPWRDVALETPHARPRCLYTRDGRTWVGLVGDIATALHGVLVCDQDLMAVEHELRTPWLVSDVHVVDDTLWVSLGPGELYSYPDRGAGTTGTLRLNVSNAPKLASHEETLLIGTTWEGVGILGATWVDGLRGKMLGEVALDAERIYAGYDDYRVRIHDRTTGRRLHVLKTGRGVDVADGTLWVVSRTGTLTAHDAATGEVRTTLRHPADHPAPTRVRIWGDRIVSYGSGGVHVQHPDGTVLLTWRCPDLHWLNDVHPIGDALHVAIADQNASRGRVLRMTLSSPG